MERYAQLVEKRQQDTFTLTGSRRTADYRLVCERQRVNNRNSGRNHRRPLGLQAEAQRGRTSNHRQRRSARTYRRDRIRRLCLRRLEGRFQHYAEVQELALLDVMGRPVRRTYLLTVSPQDDGTGTHHREPERPSARHSVLPRHQRPCNSTENHRRRIYPS